MALWIPRHRSSLYLLFRPPFPSEGCTLYRCWALCRPRHYFTWVGRDRLSLNQVARRLRQADEPTATGKQWWSRTIVWHILQNPAYKGQAAYGKTRTINRRQRLRPLRGRPIHPRHDHSTAAADHEDWISIPVPALVDESLFEAAQEQLRENRTRARQGRRHSGCLLQGLTCCSSCGYAYYAKRLRQRGAGRQLVDYVYYCCTGTDDYRFRASARWGFAKSR